MRPPDIGGQAHIAQPQPELPPFQYSEPCGPLTREDAMVELQEDAEF